MVLHLVTGLELEDKLCCVRDPTRSGPDRARTNPPNHFAHSQFISHVPRLSCHLLTHLLTLTSSASNPCRARVRRPYSPSFVLINQRSNKKVCHHKTLSHLLLLTLSPIPYGTLHARSCSSHARSLKLVASSAQQILRSHKPSLLQLTPSLTKLHPLAR